MRCLPTYSTELKCKACPSAGNWRRRTYTTRSLLAREDPAELGADCLSLCLWSGTESAGSTYLASTKRSLEMNWVPRKTLKLSYIWKRMLSLGFQASPRSISHPRCCWWGFINRLVETGVLKKVEYSEWAACIVSVPKKDCKFCPCGDNKQSHHKPCAIHGSASLAKAWGDFCILGQWPEVYQVRLAHAYRQIMLSEESQKLVTINTHKGLYHYTRLPFGVASAPAIFWAMDVVL